MNAYRWAAGAASVHGWAALHCNLLGATAVPWGPGWRCPTDGIVSTATQEWSGASERLRTATGVGQLRQTTSLEVRGMLAGILSSELP
jgi:hypothetical protein